MFPIVFCRHYDVDWLDAYTCRCRNCGKEGHWTNEGFAIWVKGQLSDYASAEPAAPRAKKEVAA